MLTMRKNRQDEGSKTWENVDVIFGQPLNLNAHSFPQLLYKIFNETVDAISSNGPNFSKYFIFTLHKNFFYYINLTRYTMMCER